VISLFILDFRRLFFKANFLTTLRRKRGAIEAYIDYIVLRTVLLVDAPRELSTKSIVSSLCNSLASVGAVNAQLLRTQMMVPLKAAWEKNTSLVMINQAHPALEWISVTMSIKQRLLQPKLPQQVCLAHLEVYTTNHVLEFGNVDFCEGRNELTYVDFYFVRSQLC
jgi:hypothetical protein